MEIKLQENVNVDKSDFVVNAYVVRTSVEYNANCELVIDSCKSLC